MGCDIHLYVEEKDEAGNWVPTKKKAPNHWYEFYVGAKSTEQIPEWARDEYKTQIDVFGEEPLHDAFNTGRVYGLFAALAGVRNYNDTIPISTPRGIPPDVSAEVNEIVKDWEADGHSHSWLLLSELLNSEDAINKASDKWMEALKDIRKDYHNVRLVFFFDS